ncbi:hypothetical protein [Neptuniibacter caesariensis]|uniref:Uncharacterized protein n=1 Tax=Neptuniibacter caesariensis TaxID=207954 RepID=A0A7U8C620_NEPCE|nr:hypothetical protein [Neptuniibacter caesariensis]EAR62235.1 hypothetical protein MED92_14398 [Oceanospirillum sp. MED92] [Neptuniibacter caesariensis]
MSGLLTALLEDIRVEYVARMQANGCTEPYVTAERLCHEKLFLETDKLAEIIEQDPTLLAARAGDLIMNRQESENPSVGVIICSNILAAALEGLLAVAVEREWLEVDEDGSVLVDEEELSLDTQYSIDVDYSTSDTAKRNIALGGTSQMSQIFAAAESAFIDALQENTREKDAYQLALDISSDFSVFAPEDISPLIAENPLLLGLRPEDLIDEDLFEGDPPAGLIISAHLTRMMLHQMLELGVEHGALALDSSGHIVVPDDPEDPPTLH